MQLERRMNDVNVAPLGELVANSGGEDIRAVFAIIWDKPACCTSHHGAPTVCGDRHRVSVILLESSQISQHFYMSKCS